jgi:hypothetical protein
MNMTVTVNKDLFDKMPKNVVEFIQANATTEYLEEKDGEIVTDIHYKGERLEATLYFNEKDTSIIARMECVMDLDTLRLEYLLNSNKIEAEKGNELMVEFRDLFNKLEKTVIDAGYQLGLSHNVGDGLFAYWDVFMKEETFDGATFLSIWQLFIEFDNKLTKTFDEFGIQF